MGLLVAAGRARSLAWAGLSNRFPIDGSASDFKARSVAAVSIPGGSYLRSHVIAFAIE